MTVSMSGSMRRRAAIASATTLWSSTTSTVTPTLHTFRRHVIGDDRHLWQMTYCAWPTPDHGASHGYGHSATSECRYRGFWPNSRALWANYPAPVDTHLFDTERVNRNHGASARAWSQTS